MGTKTNLGSPRTNQSDSALNTFSKEKTEALKSPKGNVNSKTRLKPFSYTIKSSIEMSNNAMKAKNIANKKTMRKTDANDTDQTNLIADIHE